jgi:hypothetical protein
MDPSASKLDVFYAVQKLNNGFNIDIVIQDIHRLPLLITRYQDNPELVIDVLEFNTLEDAYEFLVDVYAELSSIMAAG